MAKYYAHHVVAREQWDYETNWTHMKRNILFDVRLQAAIKPHSNLDRKRVQNNLQMAGSALNPEILQNLALHEPETFKVISSLPHLLDFSNIIFFSNSEISFIFYFIKQNFLRFAKFLKFENF